MQDMNGRMQGCAASMFKLTAPAAAVANIAKLEFFNDSIRLKLNDSPVGRSWELYEK